MLPIYLETTRGPVCTPPHPVRGFHRLYGLRAKWRSRSLSRAGAGVDPFIVLLLTCLDFYRKERPTSNERWASHGSPRLIAIQSCTMASRSAN